MRVLPTTLYILLAAALSAVPTPSRAETVDLALVLAVDVSGSIDFERFNIQRDGYAAAFTNQAVIDAIASGPHGSIAVTFVEWAGPGHQQQTIGWTLIKGSGSSVEFGQSVARVGRAYSDWTSISGAIDYAMTLLDSSGYAADRRVIDVSGDGSNNSGRSVTEARDAALAAGVTINGLPITVNEPALDTYYAANVVGGEGAFTVVVSDFESFASGVLNKLIKEIAARRTLLARLDR